MVFEHISELQRIFVYQSPENKYHYPRIIKPGCEEIEVIVSGRGHFVMNGVVTDAGPGSSLWFYEDDIVEVTSDAKDPYETIVFCYGTDRKSALKMPFYSEWESPASCERFCRSALHTFTLGNPAENYFSACTYTRLLWEADEYIKRQNRGQRPAAIDRAVSYIENYFRENISIEDIAEVAGTSTSHLHLLFRQHLGISPFQLVLKTRLNRAMELLSSSKLTIKEICYEVGFSDLKNFCTYFKRLNKLTPGQYRKLTVT